MKKILSTAIIVTLAFVLTACYSTPSDMVAIQVGDGPFEAKKIKGCKPASDRGFWTNDDYKYIPTSEREWEATGLDGADSGRFKSVTKDSVNMYVPVTIRFTIITECDTLKDFYTRYFRRYGAEFDNDGTYNKEWVTLLRKLVATPSDATLDRIVQDYPWRKVWNDPSTKVEIEDRLNAELIGDKSLLEETAKGTFFEGVSVLVGKPEPVNQELADAVATEQTKVAQAQSDEAQAKADEAKARAQVAVSRAEAAKKREEIRGYGGVDPYLRALCIQQGCNPYQPTWVYGGTAAK